MNDQKTHEGNWLREQIALLGISQSEFARRTGIVLRTMQKWFGQQRLKLRRDHAARLAAGLGMSLPEFDEARPVAQRRTEP